MCRGLCDGMCGVFHDLVVCMTVQVVFGGLVVCVTVRLVCLVIWWFV